MSGPEPVNRTSEDINKHRIEKLKDLFPEAVTEGKIDFENLRETLGDFEDDRPERYSFTWAGKRDAIRMLQTPAVGTLIPDKEESVNFETTNNIFIEGDNLEALKLLYKSYFGRIKVIYIDPPYNTGKDFIYPDNFRDPLEPYLQMTGQLDKSGNLLRSNKETSGRFHSAWLSMLYPRLFVARQLLRDDGAIFVSIDDTEIHNIRMILNEIFGEENFVSTIIWEKKFSPQNDARWLSENHDYIVVYAKNKTIWRPVLLPRTEEADSRYKNPDKDRRGPWMSSDLSVRTYSAKNDYEIVTPSGRRVMPPEGRCWGVAKERFHELANDNRIWFGVEGKNAPRVKKFLSEVRGGMTPLTIWKREDAGDTQQARREIREIFGDVGVFDTPKPIALLKQILSISTNFDDQDIVLDFFAGSGSMGHAVLELNKEDDGNRRYLLIQIPEPTPDGPFKDIAEIARERLKFASRTMSEGKSRNAVQPNQKGKRDSGFAVFKLSSSTFKQWEGLEVAKTEVLLERLAFQNETILEGAQPLDIIYELAIKDAGFGLDLVVKRIPDSEDDALFKVTDRTLGSSFYICLADRIDPYITSKFLIEKEDLFYCLDRALNDTDAANLALHCNLKTL